MSLSLSDLSLKLRFAINAAATMLFPALPPPILLLPLLMTMIAEERWLFWGGEEASDFCRWSGVRGGIDDKGFRGRCWRRMIESMRNNDDDVGKQLLEIVDIVITTASKEGAATRRRPPS